MGCAWTGKHLSVKNLTKLKVKLELISEWANRGHGIEVHFFPMTMHDLRANRFGELDEDSSGDIMPNLLKEEFYRTVLHVAGRMPLWWAVPRGTSRETYDGISARLAAMGTTAFDPEDYIDLGYVDRPGPREYLGAAMWQAHKSQRDPFKAVIKIILVLEQVEMHLKAPLLCDQVKAAILTADPDSLPIDPYLMTIRRVLDYTDRRLDKIRELVRICIWFKLLPPFDPVKPVSMGLKEPVLKELAGQWGWTSEKMDDFKKYSLWPMQRKLALGEEVKALLLDLYSRIASILRSSYPNEVMVANDDLTRLNAQILARYADHKSKVEDLPSAFHRLGLPEHLNIVYEKDRWTVRDPLGEARDYLYSSERVARVAGWMIHNEIYHPGLNLGFYPGSLPVKKRAVTGLLPFLAALFPPVNISSMQKRSLLAKPFGPRALIVNLEEHSSETKINTAEIIYRTTLGEMCHEVLPLPQRMGEPEKCIFLAHHLLFVEESKVEEINFFAPLGPARDELLGNLDIFFKRYDQKIRMGSGSVRPRSKSRLDVD